MYKSQMKELKLEVGDPNKLFLCKVLGSQFWIIFYSTLFFMIIDACLL